MHFALKFILSITSSRKQDAGVFFNYAIMISGGCLLPLLCNWKFSTWAIPGVCRKYSFQEESTFTQILL